MNIVKLKDIIKPQDDFFNKYLKGKYAWWVHMRYIIPFEKMGIQGYIACEENIEDLFKPPFKTEYRDTYDMCMVPYIDQDETNKANSAALFKMKNKYAPDYDITTEEVKQFRTWLATELLKFDQDNRGEQMHSMFDYKETIVLEYYQQHMFNDVIKQLIEFQEVTNINPVTHSACACGATDINILYNINDCDVITTYRHSIYSTMVSMFSEIDFWTQLPKEFIREFKKYIDNIIQMNLPLSYNQNFNAFADCTCQEFNNNDMDILKKLSNSLQYIIDDKISGHKNFIGDALHEWSSKLYESMQW